MLPDLSINALLQASRKADLINKTARQIIKDFAEFGLNIEFSGNTEQCYPELFGQIKVLVDELLNNDYNKFLNMLYRIDIGQGEIALYRDEMKGSPQTDIFTTLIIHRELKKVMTREYFKQKKQ